MSTANYAPFQDEYGPDEQPAMPVLPPYTDAVPNYKNAGGMAGPTSPIINRQPTVMPRDYFGLALFVTLCCCLPFGIVALIKSSDVRTRVMIGDQLGAQQASENARKFSYIGIGLGVAGWAVSMVIMIIYIVMVVVAVNGFQFVTPSPAPYLEFNPQ